MLALAFNALNVLQFLNSLKMIEREYYLVEQGEKQFFELVTSEFIVSRLLIQKQNDHKLEIGDMKFRKCDMELKK